MENTSMPDEVPIDDFAKLIGVTPRTIRNYVAEGTVTSGGRGKVRLNPSIRDLIAAARVARPDSQLDRARARALDARTRAAEQRIAREDRTLISMDDALAAIEEVTATFVVAVESLPARLTRNLQIRTELEDIVFKVREEVAEKIGKRANNLQNGVEHDDGN